MKNTFETNNEREQVVDNKVYKEGSKKEYEYFMYTTIGEHLYVVGFEHSKDLNPGEMKIYFHLEDEETHSITNLGLETFGKLADAISFMYKEISKQETIKKFLIYSAEEGHTKEMLETLRTTLKTSPEKLNGLSIAEEKEHYSIEIQDGVATIKGRNRFHLPFKTTLPVNESLLKDLKYVAHISIDHLIPDIVDYIHDPSEVTDSGVAKKKASQRLNLYKYYFNRRYPEFKTTLTKDEHGATFLEVIIPEQKPMPN